MPDLEWDIDRDVRGYVTDPYCDLNGSQCRVMQASLVSSLDGWAAVRTIRYAPDGPAVNVLTRKALVKAGLLLPAEQRTEPREAGYVALLQARLRDAAA